MRLSKFFLMVIAAMLIAACNVPEPQPAETGLTVDFIYEEGGNPLLIYFVNMSSYGLSDPYWDFGDGTTVYQTDHPSHRYSKADTYKVTLDCKDRNGYHHQASKTIDVGIN